MSDTPWVDGRTISQVLRATAQRFPNRTAAVFCQPGFRMSWREFDQEVDRVARALVAMGYERGHHFGVWATNWPEWVLLQFATARIGVVLVTVNPAYRPAELAFALKQSDVRGLAMIDQFKASCYDEVLAKICPELATAREGDLRSERFPRLKHLVRLRGAEHPGMLIWDRFCQDGQQVALDRVMALEKETRPSDPINLQFTSGTTGDPKGAVLTHRNLLLNAYYGGEGQRLNETDRICIPVPLYHCFGCVLGSLCAVVHGAAMVFPSEGFAPEQTLAAIETERCTAIYGVPTMFIAQLEHDVFSRTDCTSLRTGIMAGSPCPIELMKRVTREMGADEITIGYGQTEASPLITMTRTDDSLEKRVGTVGRVLPGVEARIVDVVTGQPLPYDAPGELCTRGHNVMLGYYNQPDYTAKAIDEEGWLHTGDIATEQADGYFRITGRLKDMIIRGGENVSPREIEEVLYGHPGVEDVQVVGVPDLRFGEEILACVRLRPGQEVDETSIREFCRSQLAHFKTPRYVWFVESFPTTVTGKIQKFKLREQAIQRFGLQDAAGIETA